MCREKYVDKELGPQVCFSHAAFLHNKSTLKVLSICSLYKYAVSVKDLQIDMYSQLYLAIDPRENILVIRLFLFFSPPNYSTFFIICKDFSQRVAL